MVVSRDRSGLKTQGYKTTPAEPGWKKNAIWKSRLQGDRGSKALPMALGDDFDCAIGYFEGGLIVYGV
jgi:hypothetical protein